MSKEDYLTAEDLIELTGAKLPKQQAENLVKNGIYYSERKDGKLKVLWHWVKNPMGQAFAKNDAGPDFTQC